MQSLSPSQPVADFLDHHVKRSTIPTDQIAEMAGLQSVDELSAMCRGKIKIPVRAIMPLAEALHIEPTELAWRVLNEYSTETADLVGHLLSRPSNGASTPAT